MSPLDPEHLRDAILMVQIEIATALQAELMTLFTMHGGLASVGGGVPEAYSTDSVSVGKRKLKNACMIHLASIAPQLEGLAETIHAQATLGNNMTDRLAGNLIAAL